jgi:hypothetical protein
MHMAVIVVATDRAKSEEINVAYVEGRKILHIHGYVGYVEVNTSQSHFVESPRGLNKRE